MHLWNIRALAEELGANRISEVTGMRYFLVSSLLVLVTTYYSMWWGAARDLLFYFEVLVLSVITVFGCFKAFEANGGNEGESFVLRAVCLSVPAGIRVTVFSILFGIGLIASYGSLISYTAFSDPQRAFNLIRYAGFVGFNIYFWWLLVNGFKRTNRIEKST